MATIIELPRSRATRARSAFLSAGSAFLSSFLALYGVAHALAFAAQWQLMGTKDVPYSTTLLNGGLDLGAAGIRIEGLLWLVAAVGFIFLGLRLAWTQKLEPVQLTAVTAFSLGLCILGLPRAGVGMIGDVLILSVLTLVLMFPAPSAKADTQLIMFPEGNNRNARALRASMRAGRSVSHR